MADASAAPRWDPVQYDRYAEHRARPFHDLVSRVVALREAAGDDPVVRVLDLGCGTGSQTATLSDRWPAAAVIGVDASPDMIDAAAPLARPDRLTFRSGDIRELQPDTAFDVVVSNAVLQWVPGHLALVPTMASWLAPGGVLAVQVPDNFSDPSHTSVRELRQSPRWRDRLGAGADRQLAVERPETYLAALSEIGLTADVWSTTYLHLLTGDDPVLEWVKGTALRPVLTALAGDAAATAEFLDELGSLLRAAYPAGPHGTVLPFRRTFAVARLDST